MRLIVSIGLTICIGWLAAQPYGNEWINYNQDYFRIKVYQDGVYRLDYEALQSAGLPLNDIAPEHFELIGKQEEQALFVEDGGDGSFDPGDYIEFVGKKNDGWLDEQLYPSAADQGNPFYSLVNDTIHYFLSWNDAQQHQRYEIEDSSDLDSYLPVDYVTVTVRKVFEDDYNFGELLAFNNNIPEYVRGEGWMSGRFGVAAGAMERTSLLSTSNKVSGSAPSAIGRTVVASASNANSLGANNHHVRVYRGENNDVQIADILYNGYDMITVDFNIPHGQLTDLTRINHRVIDDLDVPSDQNRVAFTELSYAHSLDVSDLALLHFEIAPNMNQSKYRLALGGIDIQTPIIYSLGDDPYRITGMLDDEELEALVPNQSSGSSELIVIDEGDIIQASIEAAGVQGQFTRYDTMDLDSAFIIITHEQLMPASETYANYRALGPRDALTVDIEELYDQFGGGIPKHFLGIRRYCDYVLDNWTSPPAHLFLVGKSIFLEPQNNIFGSRKDSLRYAQSRLPSFGSPGSDLLFTSGLNGSGLAPAIPTGRLSAITNEEVLDYRDKIVYNEALDPGSWMKNVVHFGGGGTTTEQNRFELYLSQYEDIIVDTCFGGNVSTFLKESSLPIEINLSDSISDIIAEGLSLITFFGHAGGGQFDQSIDEPANLEWGSHPVVLVNSCFSGDIHQPGHLSTSEQYTFIPNKGSIGFIASVQQGFEGHLHQYSTEMYRQIGSKNYGQSVGYLMQQTIAELSEGTVLTGEARSTPLMNLLQGDPAVRLFSPTLPDLSINENSVQFFPQEINPLVDTITVRVVIDNIGKTTTEDFSVELVREFPDGTEAVFAENVSGLYFRDTVYFRVPTEFASGFGLNTFKVSVDLPSNVIAELDNFLNNRVETILPITDGGVFPVMPYEFAIIPEDQVTLKASTGNPFIEARDYRLELDTTDLFDSPMILGHEVNQSGGVLTWEVPLSLIDSTVYYWRVAQIEEEPSEMLWRESSFQYIEDRTGWGQAHFFQFKKDRFNNIVYDRPERDFDFLSGTKLLSCNVYGNTISPDLSTEYFIDFSSVDYDGCSGIKAFHVAVIDPVTLEPWGTRFGDENPDHNFGNVNDGSACRARVEYYFIFRQNNEEQMTSFRNMVENEIPDGHYFLIYTWQFGQPELWATETQELFDSLGAPLSAGIDSHLPFIIAGIKGQPGLTEEVVGDNISSFITLDYDMQVSGNTGFVKSTLIGPAQSWNSLYWEGSEIATSDTAEISLLGYTPSGSEVELNIPAVDLTVAGDLALDNLIDANQYPYLRLNGYFHDPVELSPINLERWQILYEPVPEAALNPSLAYSFQGDTIQEGQDIRLITAIENISSLDMDSLLVNYWIDQSNGGPLVIPYSRQGPLLSGEVLIDTVIIPSVGLEGVNTLWVEANPINTATGFYDQLEQHHFNNIGRLRFLVQEDRENPLLDVTFDGQRILDGDIISAEPEIRIRLDDENPYLLMDSPSDTSYFSVFLTDPIGNQRRVYFDDTTEDGRMTFYPASGVDNIAEIDYAPVLDLDGVYQLLVIASDKSGNASGDINYSIRFEVDHSSSITEVLNYPNPFTTSTRFVFTLTGTDVPDRMKIQIMTVTGKVVKEIFKEELGNIHIGRNITDYAWDGRDNYGDRLANGVYFYRMIVSDSDEEIEQRSTKAADFFKKGFGKMYLMR